MRYMLEIKQCEQEKKKTMKFWCVLFGYSVASLLKLWLSCTLKCHKALISNLCLCVKDYYNNKEDLPSASQMDKWHLSMNCLFSFTHNLCNTRIKHSYRNVGVHSSTNTSGHKHSLAVYKLSITVFTLQMRGMSRVLSKAVFAFCKAALAQTHFQRFGKKSMTTLWKTMEWILGNLSKTHLSLI